MQSLALRIGEGDARGRGFTLNGGAFQFQTGAFHHGEWHQVHQRQGITEAPGIGRGTVRITDIKVFGIDISTDSGKVARLLLLCSSLVVACVYASDNSDSKEPFGSQADINYARLLWSVMERERLVGENEFKLEPFFGGAKPHGMILEIGHRIINVDGHSGFIIVKKNYNGPGVSEAAVANDRARFLSSVTAMYQRESGYDEDNKNWFWVKYQPNGELFNKFVGDKNIALAGRIAKGKNVDENSGCIYCHRSAGGGDYIFYPEIEVPK